MEKTAGGDGGAALELRGNESSFLAIFILQCLLESQVKLVSRPFDMRVRSSGISV